MALSRAASICPAGTALLFSASIAARLSLSGSLRRYHEAVHDHFNQPRNVGSFDKADAGVGSALVGKASCGDVIKLQVKVGKNGVIEDAKFKTFGCGSAIASSSLATEMIIGKHIEEASQLKNTDISSHLKLPPVKIHCSVLAEEAIQAAIADYKHKHRTAQAEDKEEAGQAARAE
eukprot:CAMPEP_0194782510 /NCGR_PEP_ID=MMETSP0323_2-20130528/78728_1 /TAXON_ID=2866 ORGANISM="Crypthecodinium cohnii, Strain Seligo" /NCGR_SAMPLE_ID=MMETSP0323_2 /ASSEMBLY_ACC=CAM_ASM_000346 /LENGTH=175 /DNA_ID=CAMNT_0039721327 /DNA_START=52 /DNA_END=579 /DNA_ORIENTATION=-